MGNLSLCGFGTFWVRSSIVMDLIMTGCITENQSFDFSNFLRRSNDWLSPYYYVGTWKLSDLVGPITCFVVVIRRRVGGEYYITIDDISYPFKTWHDENTENVATL